MFLVDIQSNPLNSAGPLDVSKWQEYHLLILGLIVSYKYVLVNVFMRVICGVMKSVSLGLHYQCNQKSLAV